MCGHVYIHICIYTSIHIYIYTYIYICPPLLIRGHIYIYIYVDICGHLYVSIDIFARGIAKHHVTTSPGLSGAALGDPLREHIHLGLATVRGWLLRAPDLSPGDGGDEW